MVALARPHCVVAYSNYQQRPLHSCHNPFRSRSLGPLSASSLPLYCCRDHAACARLKYPVVALRSLWRSARKRLDVRYSAAAISSAKPMPTKPPVASVSPSRMRFTASAAETILLFSFRRRKGKAGCSTIALVPPRRPDHGLEHVFVTSSGCMLRARALPGLLREIHRDEGDDREQHHVQPDRPRLRFVGSHQSCRKPP